MRQRRFLISLLGLALAAGGAVASPDDEGRGEYYLHRGPMPFEALDLNHDGLVSAEEHATVREQRHAARVQAGYPQRHAGRAPSSSGPSGVSMVTR